MDSAKRISWLDATKAFACILVVLGHFFQSMQKSGMIASANHGYAYFEQTIYYFHIYLFFWVSGFLYQKFSHVYNFGNHWKSFHRRLIDYGIPYITFSLITIFLNRFMSAAVDSPIQGNVFSLLLLHPISPYWFLYVLIGIFLFIPPIHCPRGGIIIAMIWFLLKILTLFHTTGVYAVDGVMSNAIWFVLGMEICQLDLIHYLNKTVACGFTVAFFTLSILSYCYAIKALVFSTVMTVLGIGMTVSIMLVIFKANKALPFCIEIISKYLLPIYVMHTIAAAGVRIILFRTGIFSLPVHVIVGIFATFVLPIVAAVVAQKTCYLNLFLYPHKTFQQIMRSRKSQIKRRKIN